MIVSSIQGNIHSPQGAELIAGKHIEKITLPAADFVKRIQRLTTDHGTVIGLNLPTGAPDLSDGDILQISADNAIVVTQLPTDVLVIAPASIKEMGVVAHNLGNRHLPAQFFDDNSEYHANVMVVQYDHTVAEFLDHLGVTFTREQRTMPTPFRHAEHTH